VSGTECSCTFEAGDSACATHPTCPECGSVLDGFWGRVAARLAIESKQHATDVTRLTADNERLTRELEREDRIGTETLERLEAREEQINNIADALGDEGEYSNLHDRGDAAYELACSLTAERDSALAELASLKKYIATHDEEYLTMKDVLRAEHAECQRMRPVFEAALEWHDAWGTGRTNGDDRRLDDAIDAATTGSKA
jgi:hypothetical protein